VRDREGAVILIGQYDSPFVRRVGIALELYKIPYRHEPWSVFGDAERIRPHNPLVRVPTLVLDDGTALLESTIILDYLDHRVPAERALVPADEPARHRALRICALATGLGDKAVSLFYEHRLHRETSEVWVARCRSQIAGVLAVLEAERAARSTPHWFGDQLGHADIAVAVVLRFIGEVHGAVVALADFPALAAHAARLEALPVFQRISQPFNPPT
jgi:glutathione S-transferase